MLKRIRSALSNSLIRGKKAPIVLGVSGGPDSLCLLDIMNRLDYQVIVAHLNHCLRAEAKDEAKYIARLSETYQSAFVLEEINISAYAERYKLTVEEAARNVRYGFLFNQAQKFGAQAVVVGHNADDQVETVLMHWLRGTGLSGLKGMPTVGLPNPWSDEIPLVRPLLNIWREEILAYCNKRGITPVFDQSNLDTRYYRNRLRHELIPMLEEYNPGWRKRILQLVNIIEGDNQVLENATHIAWLECLCDQANEYVILSVDKLVSQPIGLQRRLIRRAISCLKPDLRDIGYSMVERIISLLELPSMDNQQDLGAEIRVFIEEPLLYISNSGVEIPKGDWPQVPPGAVITLSLPGVVNLMGGWQLCASLKTDVEGIKDQVRFNENPYLAWIDIGDQPRDVVVRSRKAGEWFQPLGMQEHSMKLSDFMINEKVPKRARKDWPLVCVDDEVAWIAGHQIAHPFRITDESRVVLHLRLEK
jgi:tRNA(Ile)-lysidine synthase